MRDRPAGVQDGDLMLALAEGWHIRGVGLQYAPVGGGSYHWVVRDGQGACWFVTVDDLDDKAWLGQTRAAVSGGLRAAMDTAFALRHHDRLRFVVAPIPAVHGETVLPVSPKYAVAVFPFVRGASGRFGEERPADERQQLVDMLAKLHRSTSAATRAPHGQIVLPRRDVLEAALGELHRTWHGGPFAEPARALLASSAERLRHLLETFDQLAEHVAASPELVITHGEPHPANIIRAGHRGMLIDWDTVGLGPPERDLWFVVTGTGDEARRYSAVTGRPVNRPALAFYRIRWALDDISAFVHQLRARHCRTAHTEHMWLALQTTLTGAIP